MIVVEEARRGLEELTDEQFVSAVIRVHERVITGLRALADGTSPRGDTAGEDAEIIRSYAALHGLDDSAGDVPALPFPRPLLATPSI